MSMDHVQEKDCTLKCRSLVHAKQILDCVASATAPQIRAYCVWLCHNFSVILDDFGRNLLHVASSCGKWEIVEWLLKYCNVDVDIKDKESGWTALHRSLFYGQLSCARVLSMHGANFHAVDHERFTPLDIIVKDRLPYIEYLSSSPSEVYAWGSNFNYNLGIGKTQSRNDPEILEVFRKDSVNIEQVVICKFHSVFLSASGKVYTCGCGHGGRLGQDSDDICLVPSLVKGIGTLCCMQIAAGQDHILLLLNDNQVWSCGLNIYHQLGLIPPPESTAVPKPLSLKFLKGKEIIGIRAARFHSVIYTKDSVYTFGLNAGELGHPKGERTQVHPRQVSTLYNETWSITHVEASDGATVVATSRGDVYVLHEYQTRKIASRQLEILKLSVVGGHLDYRCDVAGVREGGGAELRVMLLTKSGKVFLWRQTDPYLRRCIFPLSKQLIINDLHINHYSVGLITNDGEGYIGNIIPFKGQRTAPSPTSVSTPSLFSAKSSTLTPLLDTNDCHLIRVKKLPYIYRGTSITSDSKGRNFAVRQVVPKMGLLEIPFPPDSQMQQDFFKFYSGTCIEDDFHDVIIKVGRREFAAHKYILSTRSNYFKKQLVSDDAKDVLAIEHMRPEVFEQVLQFIYYNSCDFLTPGYEVKWQDSQENGKKKKPNMKSPKRMNPVDLVQEASRRLSVPSLAKMLGHVQVINGKITLLEKVSVNRLSYDRKFLASLADVNVLSPDGAVFRCHKCILAARLDYFHSMLSTMWAENSQLGQLSLPIASPIMEVVLDYVYTDASKKLLMSEDADFLCQVLMVADQLLMTGLKEMCEMYLVDIITLKNAAELLELASVYNALQLKRSCMQFICINLPAVLEAKSLEVLSDEVMEDLSCYYRNLIPGMNSRRITSFGPSQEVLAYIEKCFPISESASFVRNRTDYHDTKKSKRRWSSSHTEGKDVAPSRNKSASENSGKGIVLDIVLPVETKKEIQLYKVELENSPIASESKKKSPVEDSPTIKPVHWAMKSPPVEEVLALDKIMLEEQLNWSTPQKKTVMKPMPHISQKQRKSAESRKEKATTFLVPNTTPVKNSCPWAKLPEQSPPSPSFWDTLAKKEFQPSSIISDARTTEAICQSPTRPLSNINSSPSKDVQEPVISLDDIQKEEELKLRKAVNPKIKSLDILNIEDQAIEELIARYSAKDNAKEKITVSRVLPEEIASPVWRKRGH